MYENKLREIEKINIHDLVKSARTHAKLTQQELADALGIDRSTYSYCETGRTKLDIIFLLKVCNICNISLEDVLKANPSIAKANMVSSNVPPYLFNKESSLSEREQTLIAHIRQLDQKDQAMVFDMANRLTEKKQ